MSTLPASAISTTTAARARIIMPGAVVLALVFTGVTGLRGVIGTAGLGRQAFSLASEFDFGFEQGHIAGHLARGQGYSVSFGDSAPMPTAWASPLYPVLLAGVFRWLGTYSYESAIAVIWLNAICHGGIAVLLLMTGRRIDSFGGAKAGWIAVLLFVAMPMGWQFLQWAWCVHLLALLLLWHLYLLCSPAASRSRGAVWIGVSLGLALLTDGAAITIIPVTVAVIYSRGGRLRQRAGSLAVCGAAMLVTLAPWMVRNGMVLGTWSPLRGMLGTALWMGNHPGAAAEDYHGLTENPWHNAEAGRRFIELGEREFDNDCKTRFTAQLRQQHGTFVHSTVMRASGFWLNEWWRGWSGYPAQFSLGIVLTSALALAGAVAGVRRGARIGALIWAALLFPLPYYITFLSFGRYRLPIEPVLYLLAAQVFLLGGPRRAMPSVRAIQPMASV